MYSNGRESNEVGGDIQRNYFEMIVTKLIKDIEEIVRIC